MSVKHDDSHSRKHAQAVANTLHMADEAAELGHYREAISWLETVQAIGERLPDEYRRKHTAWREQAAAQHAAAGSREPSLARALRSDAAQSVEIGS